MSLCPNCKKTSLELVNKPSKVSEFFSQLKAELLISVFVISFITRGNNLIVTTILILVVMIIVVYLISRKKENPLSKCLSCDNVFDEETIQKAQRFF